MDAHDRSPAAPATGVIGCLLAEPPTAQTSINGHFAYNEAPPLAQPAWAAGDSVTSGGKYCRKATPVLKEQEGQGRQRGQLETLLKVMLARG